MISIQINEAEITAALSAAISSLSDMSQVMNKVGAAMRDQAEDRFKDGKDPDGNAWAPRSPVTVAAYERRAQKPGGVRSWGGVLHYSGQLSGNIFHEYGSDFAQVGSPEPYAAMMQFGGTKARFPNLWGDIPARPFFGIGDEDRQEILDLISDALDASLQP